LIVAFMDDLTLAGDLLSVAADVNIVSSQGANYGLQLNFSKCEAITQNGTVSHATFDAFQRFTPGTAVLLGAPLAAGQAMTGCLTARCTDLSRAAERLKIISACDALVLLTNSLSSPKLQYLLRADCCDGHDLLTSFDNILRSAMCSVCNVSMTDLQWLQASLPVRAGGFGIRPVSSLASSAFLASAAGTRDLQDRILCLSVDVADEAFDLCLEARLIKFPMQPPTGSSAGKQNMGQCRHCSGIQFSSRLLFRAHSQGPTSGSSCATQWRLASHSTHSGLWIAS
jgi:hypothetical protein